ncbi:unnamed protein product [Acanthoscelides obtectus]|uniref:Small subunit processome component 20 homolog n=1 Tax=Acanthoscelides obtectus TaxID=200917 RepID=A0A9P0LX06_ACAOB|nr:unnamed protein product [Acanthoscelides obtectus]CAK1645923.1 Small subunit processome component 20 homolog [Acanthoscelides obtectus]
MKNKSTRHKIQNTFKFLPFAERIANIDVDVFHKVSHEYEDQYEENESYFHQTIEKWNVLNLSEGYEAFRKEVRDHEIITLPQLLLVKERVTETLLKHLKLRDTLYLQPLLELVVALAKDLQKEFYSFYPQFLEVLILLLNTKDSDQLEWTFTCLAYIFKFLWRPLVKDINKVFKSLLPLLSDTKPEYVNNFAAESFAFVARKVKDKRSFLVLLLKAVENHSDGTVGCAKLLFHVINGVDRQFHSYAETIFPFLLESLSDESLPQNTLCTVLTHIVDDILNNIHPQKADLFWTSCLNRINTLLDKNSSTNDENVIKNIDLLMKIIEQAIEFKSGKFLTKPIDIIQLIMKILSDSSMPEYFVLTVSRIGILILLSKNLRLTQEQASMLTRKMLALQYEAVLLRFVEQISPYTGFEALVLPNFLRYMSENPNDECLQVLTKVLLKKSPLCESGIGYHDWKKYPIDFKEYNTVIMEVLHKQIKTDTTEIMQSFDSYLCSLICLPHLFIKPIDEVKTVLHEKLVAFVKMLDNTENIQFQKHLFMLNNTLECLLHLGELNIVQNIFMGDLLQKLLDHSSNPKYILSLKTISLCLTALHENTDIINMDTLKKINKTLEKNFSSPYHEMRLLTAQIYTNFENLSEFNLKHSQDPEVVPEQWKVFSICYEVESTDPQVDTYREQLQRLEKLSYERPQMLMCSQTEFKTIPLRYVCGSLYMNFRLIWDPVTKLIATHAQGMSINEFWDVFGNELIGVCQNIEGKMQYHPSYSETKFDFVGELFRESQEIKSKPDFINYRILLWKAMAMFPNVPEAKTRDVSELVLNFIGNEYVRFNSEGAAFYSIKQKSNEAVIEDLENEDASKQRCAKEFYLSKKLAVRTLLQKLAVFSQIKSPLSMYREPELYKLYFDLLQNKAPAIQKSALDCIMTYKNKSLTPYKDRLYNLVDENNFKHEITSFRIDKDSDMVQSEHREVLIPLVMQIVFCKMSAKIGLRTGGKSSGQLKRNQIVRFLAGCEEDEILIFLQKALKLYSTYLESDPLDIVKKITDVVNLEKFLPPKRLQSTVNLLTVIFEQCGGLLGEKSLGFLLKVLLTVGSFLKVAHENSEQVHSGFSTMLRNVRTSSIKLLAHFYHHFDKYRWTCSEINAVFTVFVWPYVDKLNTEGIHSPTTLLKLFVQWGSNPRYFSLLVKCKDEENQYVLQHVIKLFCNEKANVAVVNAIEEMLEKVLLLEEDEEDKHLKMPVENLQPIEKSILEKVGSVANLNYGSCILLPHVPAILDKIKKKLITKTKNLNTKELFILSRVSELVWEPDLSDTVLDLLLPIVLKKTSAPEEVVLKYVESMCNLIRNVSKPDIHLKELSPLFGQVTYTTSRKVLVKVLEVISAKSENEDLKNVEIIPQLNAYDKKWVDQPDFECRHNAFKNIQSLMDKNEISLPLGILIIHNCFFFMKSERDLSLKESSSHTLRQISVYLLRTFSKQTDIILNESLFTLIRATLKNQDDNVRNEAIQLLGHIVRECPEAHFILTDLNHFTNKADPEVDFFENLTHLQIHRHARALIKFSQITQELTVSLNPRTLTQFVLPLASHYLCNEKYVGKNSVIDAAIEAIGTMCRLLPWHQYEGLLRYYLDSLSTKMEYQKQLVRLTVAILDAFHFDLGKGIVAKKVEEVDTIEDDKTEKSADKMAEDEKVNDESVEMEKGVDEYVETEEVEAEDAEEKEDEVVKITEKTTVLCKSTATRVIRTIQFGLLPKLHKTLAELTHHDTSHKINRKKLGIQREEEDLMKVPISLAVVKLLQRLPVEIMEANLPGVFMKTCTFLKSHLDSVRKVARETLQKIMLTLGPKYLKPLLNEMAPLLNRGFQVHVLVFTIHGVLNCLKNLYQTGDIDEILLTVLNLCTADLFGVLSEEKEIAKIAVKVSEARHTKTFDTLQILAQFISDSCFLDLIFPIKKVLERTHSFKTVSRVQEALRFIALGLVDNQFIPVESLLKFAFGIASKSIPQLLPKAAKHQTNKGEKKKIEKEDCFIIQKIPDNRKAYREQNVKIASDTNAHVLVEFGLRLCLLLLKRDKVRDSNYKKFMDPFVNVVKDCLKSKQVKLCTLTLQCLTYMFKYDLPSLKNNMKVITKDIMVILHKYASAGLSKGDNFDLVISAFKAVAVLVRDAKYHIIDVNQLKVLLLYAEQDIHDHERQATAFSLLRSIIARKLDVSEMADVMGKVAELSIISELEHVRAQARSVFHLYMMDYPLGDSLEKHIGFYISQMSYEMKYGRQSAIEMIHTFINSFPVKVLNTQSGTLLITLGARLVNDDDPDCRKAVADCIVSMLQKLPKEDYEPLFDIVTTWLKDKNLSHRRLAAQLCGLFVTVEKSAFETRIPKLSPLILKQFGLESEPGKFVKLQKEKKNQETEEYQHVKDHHLFQVLQFLLKLCANCPAFLRNKELIENLAVHIQTLLSYPHEWVRLAAAQFLGYVLSTMDTERLSKLLLERKTEDSGFLYSDPENALKSLTLDLCDQLQPGVTNDLAEQVVKNLVFVARVLQHIPLKASDSDSKLNLLWLAKRMRKIVNSEIVEKASVIVLRTEVFKWIAGVITALDMEKVRPVLHHLMAPLVRELITTEEKNAPLRQLAKEVTNMLKKKIGMEEYTQVLSKLQQNLSVKRAERKRARTQLAVTDPEIFAKKKLKRQERKKESKKRKMAEMKGKKLFKKRKVLDMELDSSEIF